MNTQQNQAPIKPTVENLARAIFIVNRHAKTATNPKFLYLLKRKALEKLLIEGNAKKEGLHFSRNPKNSRQQSDVLVSAGDYFFHMPPSKEDFAELPHLGTLNQSYRNPKTHLSLLQAKNLLQQYVGMKEDSPSQNRKTNNRSYNKPVFKKLGESYF
ncbi:YkyB family protein [Cytobacillus sp. S13-E01]|uniref:YkyB family protein n=1 Tax=Cytobacillus sp. S13-E01 TaxID=3031326 RepID=UPI0023D81347|nr:YkyB family protein [Cytobacillus sp. S13-E01]MDF0725389.1 YkyB family protein [Cytobacillus sp. S13-E01]